MFTTVPTSTPSKGLVTEIKPGNESMGNAEFISKRLRPFLRMRKISEANAQAVSARLASGPCLERKRALHRCDAGTAHAHISVRIHAHLDSPISTDAPSLSRHIICAAGRQQSTLPLESSHAAVTASADWILLHATGR